MMSGVSQLQSYDQGIATKYVNVNVNVNVNINVKMLM